MKKFSATALGGGFMDPLLKDKTEELKNFILPSDNSYLVHTGFHNYLDGVLPIVDQFI